MANIDRTFQRGVYVSKVRTEGSTKNLGPTELALVNLEKPKAGGYDALKDLSGVGKNDLIKLKWGNPNPGEANSKWQDNFDIGTMNIRKEDIIDLRVDVPQSSELKADIWAIGYNGKKGTGIQLNQDSTLTVAIELSGEPIELAGYAQGKVLIQEQLFAPRELPSEDNFITHVEQPTLLEKRTMHELVKDAVERLKEKPMLNGQKLKDFVDIKLVTSKASEKAPSVGKVTEVSIIVPFGFNDQEELTDIQSKFPQGKVEYDPTKVVDRAVCYRMFVEGDGKEVKGFEYIRKSTPNLTGANCEGEEAKAIETKTTVVVEVVKTLDVAGLEYEMVLPDTECGESRLEELKKYYGDSVIEITETEDSGLACTKVYKAKVKGVPADANCEGQVVDTVYEVSPKGFKDHAWKLVVNEEFDADTEVGILIEGHTVMTGVDKPYDSDYPTVIGFTKMRVWASDELNTRRYSENNRTNAPQTITNIQRGSKPDGLGYEYLQTQVADQFYFRGEVRKQGNIFYNGNYMFGSPIRVFMPYVNYFLTVQKKNDRIFAHGIGEGTTYRFIVEKGKHEPLEKLLNAIAKGVGLDEVKAY